jgi:FHA domain
MSLAAVLLAAPATGTPSLTPPPESSSDVPWLLFGLVAAVVVGAGVVLLILSQRKSKAAAEERCAKCGKVMMSDWPKCMFCKTPRAQPGLKNAALEVTSGPLLGRNIPLESEVTTIGSAPGSTLQLSDAGVSRKHAGIRKADGGFELADMGSTNGVYVNGERVARRKLQVGDVIRVGATEMVFKG